ncbi:MAG TPA: YCF48-related protein [Ignavibacteria bacterium]|jgi:photosystem II stability/assembly factor-like uncharacterized protein
MKLLRFFSALMIFLNVFIYGQTTLVEQSVKYIDLTNATLVGEDGLAMKTSDGGFTWQTLTTGITNVLYGNIYFDKSTMIAVGENGVIIKTTNAGLNWEIKQSTITTHLCDVGAIDSNTAVACGCDGILLLTSDKGDTWEQIYTQPGYQCNDIHFINSMTGFAVGTHSMLLKTTDGAVNWTDMRITIPSFEISAISPRTDEKLTIVGEAGKIYNSTDGGFTWTPSNTVLPDLMIKDVSFTSENDGIAVGEDESILRTTDGGDTWVFVIPTTRAGTRDFQAVSFSTPLNGMLVGENGVQAFTTDGGETWSYNPVKPSDRAAILTAGKLGNYPNPFNPTTKISFELPASGTVSVNIYDISGREVSRLFDGNAKAGLQEFIFDASKLSSGVYFYKVTSSINGNINVQTGRMLLVK